MKAILTSALLSSTVAVAVATLPVYSADSGQKAAAKPAAFSFNAPLRGAPATRVGGASRSAAATAMSLDVLAPNQTGYTTQASPTIYWYVSETINKPVEVTLTGTRLEDAVKPLLEVTLQPPISKGIHALRLEDHGVSLKPDAEYQYFVAVVKNYNQRADDVIAGGSIKRVSASADVQAKLKQASPVQAAAVYAESGIWYDAIDALSKQIAANPALRAQRAALLEQVGLNDVAAFDRGS
jgi:Domain of Unknown Function (DUF928)